MSKSRATWKTASKEPPRCSAQTTQVRDSEVNSKGNGDHAIEAEEHVRESCQPDMTSSQNKKLSFSGYRTREQ